MQAGKKGVTEICTCTPRILSAHMLLSPRYEIEYSDDEKHVFRKSVGFLLLCELRAFQ